MRNCHHLSFIGIAFMTLLTPSARAGDTLATPPESSIPANEQGKAIRWGKVLLTETKQRLPKNVGNGLNCSNCHLQAGTVAYASPWVGIWGVFPEYRSRSGKLISLQERINDCFERSMNGKALDVSSDEMNSILAYMRWLSTGVPTGTSIAGRGFGPVNQKLIPDSVSGKRIYQEKCVVCHTATGTGVKSANGYAFPPLWGSESFNDGAGMARTYTAAAFIKHNMPLGQGGTLSDQDAIDVAEYMTHQNRPIFTDKTKDWPKGDKPKDARN